MSVDESSSLSQSVGISSLVCDNSSVSPVVDSTPGASTALPSVSKISKTYMTKNRKKIKKAEDMNAKASKFSKAIKDLNRGKFSSVKKCAAFYSSPLLYPIQSAHNRNR